MEISNSLANKSIYQSPFIKQFSINDKNFNQEAKLVLNINFPKACQCNENTSFCIKTSSTINNFKMNPNYQMQNIKTRVLFSKEEDEKLKQLVELLGSKRWSLIASFIEGRTPKQCRDRYKNYLEPGFFKGEWSKEEDELLLKLYEKIGPKWATLAKSFNDRSSSSIKNRWKYFLCRQYTNKSKNLDESSNSGNTNQNIKKDLKSIEIQSYKSNNCHVESKGDKEFPRSTSNGIEVYHKNNEIEFKLDAGILKYLEMNESDIIDENDCWSLYI